jgi:signal transduction histidine kinase
MKWTIIGVALGSLLSVGILIYLGSRSITNWQGSARIVAQQGADTAVNLLVNALVRDMRAVQSNVLSSLNLDEPTANSTTDLYGIVSAFARYPYPEVFFIKRHPENGVLFYGRTSRHPTWLKDAALGSRSPVVWARQPAVSDRLMNRIDKDAQFGRRFSVFEMLVAGKRYQVIALVSYQDSFRERPASVVGFMVDLEWVRANYFKNVLTQIAHIGGETSGVNLTILDEHGLLVAGSNLTPTSTPSARREMPLLFADPSFISTDAPEDLAPVPWTAVAVSSHNATLAAADAGARQALGLAALAVVLMAVALALSIRAERAHSAVTEMRSEFVYAVTHELKTPIAGVRAVTELLASGRLQMSQSALDYARLAVGESKRLARLVENLLAYARVTDVAQAYTYEVVGVHALVQDSLNHFWAQLTSRQFEQDVQVPDDLPPVRVDRTAIDLTLSNLIDNAIRYSIDKKHLSIRALKGRHPKRVVIEITDRGPGIAETEIPHLTRKFFRGANAGFGGTGLGLAIANRIVTDHGGTLTIQSTVGLGTTVSIELPRVS